MDGWDAYLRLASRAAVLARGLFGSIWALPLSKMVLCRGEAFALARIAAQQTWLCTTFCMFGSLFYQVRPTSMETDRNFTDSAFKLFGFDHTTVREIVEPLPPNRL